MCRLAAKWIEATGRTGPLIMQLSPGGFYAEGNEQHVVRILGLGLNCLTIAPLLDFDDAKKLCTYNKAVGTCLRCSDLGRSPAVEGRRW